MRQLWALMLFLLLVGCMSLPTADPTPATPTAVALLPTPTPAPATSTATWTPAPTATATPTPTATFTVTPTASATATDTVTLTASATPTETATPTPAAPTPIPWEMAGVFAGEDATVCGPVVRTYFAKKTGGSPTFLDIGLPYPDPGRLNVIIWGRYRDNFPQPPERMYYQKTICVSGRIELYQGVAQIEVRSPEQIIEQTAP